MPWWQKIKIGSNMKEMNQRKVLGISIKAFALLMLVVCFIYEITTPSDSTSSLQAARFANMWFSYLVGVILYAIGFLMAFRQ